MTSLEPVGTFNATCAKSNPAMNAMVKTIPINHIINITYGGFAQAKNVSLSIDHNGSLYCISAQEGVFALKEVGATSGTYQWNTSAITLPNISPPVQVQVPGDSVIFTFEQSAESYNKTNIMQWSQGNYTLVGENEAFNGTGSQTTGSSTGNNEATTEAPNWRLALFLGCLAVSGLVFH